MGIIITLILGAIGTWLVSRILPATRAIPLPQFWGGGALGAVVTAWIVGSLVRQASFMMNPPGPLTMLGALVGGVLGAVAITLLRPREA